MTVRSRAHSRRAETVSARVTESGFVAFSSSAMNRDDLLALLGVRQVHEENLVEASLARQLGGQLADVVRGGHHEDGGLPILQPGEQPAEHALGEAGVGVAARVVREAL